MCRPARRSLPTAIRPYTMTASPSTAITASKRIQPEGLEKEAHVLSQLAEIPSMTKAWIREDATDNIMHFTV